MKNDFSWLKNRQFLQEGGRASYLYPNYIFCTRALVEHPFWSNDIPLISISKNHTLSWYYAVGDMSQFDYSLQRILKDETFLDRGEKYSSEIADTEITRLQSFDFAKSSDQSLLSLYEKYMEAYENIGIMAGFLRHADRAVQKRIGQMSHSSKPDERLAVISYPSKRTYSRQEEVAILKLAIQIQQAQLSEVESKKEIEKLWKNFESSSLGYVDEPAKSLHFFEEKIKEEVDGEPEKKLNVIISEEKHFTDKKKQLKETPGEEDRKVIDAAGSIVYLKDHYKFVVNRLQYAGEPLFQELGKKAGVSASLIKDMLPAEVKKAVIEKSIDRAVIEERVKKYVICPDKDNKSIILTGKDADEFEKMFLRVDMAQKEFKGRIACKGKGVGRARIVTSPKDFHKMEQGDILIVMNTSPDFVPIMKRAAAIVAEEGGITGHVSVVSREFGIPAVVGITQITKIIKDGDMVEVDAEKGIVKILS